MPKLTAFSISLVGLVFLSLMAARATNVCENNRFVNILALFVPLNIEIQGTNRDFKTYDCKKPLSGWQELLTIDQPISKHYVITDRCDVGGRSDTREGLFPSL